MLKETRLERIFKALASGLPVEKINEELAQSLLVGQEGQTKGVQTEKKVAGILAALAEVQLIDPNKWGSRADNRGIDLNIKVKVRDATMHLAVQVKSSKSGVRKYRGEIRRRFKLQEHEIDDWLKMKGRVLINGGVSETVIIESFRQQVGDIYEFRSA